MVMTDKEKIITVCRELISRVEKSKNKDIIVRDLEWRTITHDCLKELKLVDGAMQNVGETKLLGYTYEIRVEVLA